MTILSRAIPCALAAFLLMAADEPPAADVVAQSGSVRITAPELKETLGNLDPGARAQITATPAALTNFVRDRLLNSMVLAEAKSKDWDTRPDVVRKIAEARDAVILQSYLASVVPVDSVFPSEADVTTAYENNKGRLMLPRQFHLSQIVLIVKAGAPPEEDEAAHKKAIDLRAQAVRPKADFADIARRSSQEQQSAAKGGDVGWLKEPDMVPPIRDAVAALSENGISQPVKMADGWHILKLLETKPPGQIPLLDAKPQIVQALRQARAQRIIKAYVDDMLKTQPIQVNEIEINKQAATPK
jgi:PPIC-type PPIASE domain